MTLLLFALLSWANAASPANTPTKVEAEQAWRKYLDCGKAFDVNAKLVSACLDEVVHPKGKPYSGKFAEFLILHFEVSRPIECPQALVKDLDRKLTRVCFKLPTRTSSGAGYADFALENKRAKMIMLKYSFL